MWLAAALTTINIFKASDIKIASDIKMISLLQAYSSLICIDINLSDKYFKQYF